MDQQRRKRNRQLALTLGLFVIGFAIGSIPFWMRLAQAIP